MTCTRNFLELVFLTIHSQEQLLKSYITTHFLTPPRPVHPCRLFHVTKRQHHHHTRHNFQCYSHDDILSRATAVPLCIHTTFNSISILHFMGNHCCCFHYPLDAVGTCSGVHLAKILARRVQLVPYDSYMQRKEKHCPLEGNRRCPIL